MYNHNRRRPRGRFLLFPLIVLVWLLVLGGVVMLLWNAILVPVLNVRSLTYGQGVGLLALCRILFGSFRRGGIGGPPNMYQRKPWREKWMQMNPEERQQFKEEWKRRCSPPQKSEGEE